MYGTSNTLSPHVSSEVNEVPRTVERNGRDLERCHRGKPLEGLVVLGSERTPSKLAQLKLFDIPQQFNDGDRGEREEAVVLAGGRRDVKFTDEIGEKR